MPFNFDDATVQALEESALSDPHKLYARIGYFIYSFGEVEFRLTQLMAVAFQARSQALFDFVARGMDCKAKIERLQSGDGLYFELGKNIRARLIHMQKHSISIRNHIAHSLMGVDKDTGDIHFMSLGAMPIIGGVHLTPTHSPSITAIDFFKEAIWLRAFSDDIKTILDDISSSREQGIFEITSPKTNLPKEDRPPPLRKAPRANRRKPQKKRRAKHQTPPPPSGE